VLTLKPIWQKLYKQRTKLLQHPFPHWTTYKQSQWMVLNRAHVQLMRGSPMTATYLAYSEWVFIPDEAFFSTLFRNFFSDRLLGDVATQHPEWVMARVVNSNQRWLQFSGAHPVVIEPKHFPSIFDKVLCDDAVACRKVSHDMMPRLDRLRDLDRKRVFGGDVTEESQDWPKMVEVVRSAEAQRRRDASNAV
jgi:hypothetical protein